LNREFHPKLGDFGLSRMLATTTASATNLVGTPTHMAPEQFLSRAKHNPMKADVYSFGMLLYELATNKVLSRFHVSLFLY
jgi:serine/threonine protein kinase